MGGHAGAPSPVWALHDQPQGPLLSAEPDDPINLYLLKAIESHYVGRCLLRTPLRHKGHAVNLEAKSRCHHRACPAGDTRLFVQTIPASTSVKAPFPAN